MAHDIEVHFNRMGPGGGTLVVVAIGAEVYGATDLQPVAALRSAARKASEDLALRGRPVDPDVIMECGREELKARARRSSPPREQPKPPAAP
jgi:hypothetical protein